MAYAPILKFNSTLTRCTNCVLCPLKVSCQRGRVMGRSCVRQRSAYSSSLRSRTCVVRPFGLLLLCILYRTYLLDRVAAVRPSIQMLTRGSAVRRNSTTPLSIFAHPSPNFYRCSKSANLAYVFRQHSSLSRHNFETKQVHIGTKVSVLVQPWWSSVAC